MAKVLNIAHMYPRLSDWIEKNLPLIETFKPRVFKAFVKHSQLTKEQASLALKNGFGPEVLIKKIYPRNGLYDHRQNKNSIILSENIARRFETQDYSHPYIHVVLESTLIHEMTHWGDIKVDGKQQVDKNGNRIEEGQAFEREAYGMNIDPYWTGRYNTRLTPINKRL